MIPAPQKVAALIGKAGCYFLSILREAEKITGRPMDPFHCYVLARESGWMAENCFVRSPHLLLGGLAGGRWIVLKAGDGKDSAGQPYDLPLAYALQDGERDIQRWEIPGAVDGHFICADGWDPYGDSLTVAHGKLVSRRIFRKVA